MTFKKYDSTKLLDDIKIISKSVRIVKEENNPDNRKYACGVVEDLLNRLWNDISEMTEGFVQPDQYDGTGHVDIEE